MEISIKKQINPFEIVVNNDVPVDTYRDALCAYSSSIYGDDEWIIDKRYRDRFACNERIVLSFKIDDDKIKRNLKEYALDLLVSRLAPGTISPRLRYVKLFYQYMIENHSIFTDKKIEAIHIYEYFNFIMQKDIKLNSKSDNLHCVKMYFEWKNNTRIIRILNKYDIPSQKVKKNDVKYIDKCIIEKLDIVFLKENCVPLEDKVFYWTLRLFPSRRGEISSMKLDCLQKVTEMEYILKIPTFKQAGQYVEGGTRKLGLYKEGILEFYIELLQEQIRYSILLQTLLPDRMKGFLFARIPVIEYGKTLKRRNTKPSIIGGSDFNRTLSKICKLYNVCDENGNIAYVTSHQFRHNGITDRIESGIFRAVDIMAITASKSIEMINDAYVHYDNAVMREQIKNINQIQGDKMMEFKGKIISEKRMLKENKILLKPFAHRIGGIGICSDISQCESSMFECLNCPSFIPDTENEGYYEEQVKEWDKKINIAKEYDNAYLLARAKKYKEINQNWLEKIHVMKGNII